MGRLIDDTLPWENKGVKIAVIGDLILDEYLEGEVSRISPEAPVPVHLVRETRESAGGAGNVARNIVMAGGQAMMFGVVGRDGTGDALIGCLERDGIDLTHTFRDEHRITTRKTRVSCEYQQLVRIDWEKPVPLSQSIQTRLMASLEVVDVDVVVVSDYSKGSLPEEFLKQMMALFANRKIPVLIDPKGRDFSKYQGSFLITPNWKESCEALGVDALETEDYRSVATQLQERYHLSNVLITLGGRGMYYQGTALNHYLPAEAREVFDVSGAGDTVVAVLSLAIAAGLEIPESMTYANLAAGRVVEKRGTQPITKAEMKALIAQIADGFGNSLSKIIDRSAIKNVVNLLQLQHKKIVFTNGCFDILHAGHISYLEEAKRKGDVLIVGVNSDQSVRKLKGSSRPLIPLGQRMRILGALQCVDFVVSFEELTPEHLISSIAPDVLVKGADYQMKDIVGADGVLKSGGEVERIDYVHGVSTTEIIRRVKHLSAEDR